MMHQDLKSQNILVESCSSLSVKLADFNLANNKSDLITLCDIKLSIMSKIYSEEKYTILINI